MRAGRIRDVPVPANAAAIPIEDFLAHVPAEPNVQAPAAPVPPAKPPKLNVNVRVGPGRDPLWAYCFCRRLIADTRFGTLVSSYRHILLVAALEFADVDGVFWPKRATWGSVANEHPETVKRAVRAAESLGLLERHPHGRPNGRQGSNTYVFDVALVRAAHDDMDWFTRDLP